MHILFLTQILPYPPTSGPKVKTWHVLRYLSERGHKITLASFVCPEELPYIENVKKVCAAVHAVPVRRSRVSDVYYLLRSQFTGRPFLVERDDLTYQINHVASVRLAELAKQVGVARFLFSSSCSTYGAAAGDDMLTEEAAFNPVTPYGHSKVLVEQDVAKLADDHFSPTFLRNATAYGVSPRLRFDIVLNNLVAWAFSMGRVLIKSDGTPWRPIIHIEDISRAFIAVLNASREVIHNQAFNVGQNDQNYRIRDLADIVKEVVPGSEIEYAQNAGPDKRTYRVDFSKIARMLPEFEPQSDARKGAKELYDAYCKTDLKLDQFEGPKYKRIDHIKQLIHDGLLDETLRWMI